MEKVERKRISRKEEKMDEKQRQSKKKKEGKGFPFAWEEK